MMFTLRDYQEEAVYSVFDYYASGKVGNPVVAEPTGTGKSVVIAV
jgi:DNA repair protein RadD